MFESSGALPDRLAASFAGYSVYHTRRVPITADRIICCPPVTGGDKVSQQSVSDAGGHPEADAAQVWPESKTAAYCARVHEHHVVAVGNTTDIHYFDLRMVRQVCRWALAHCRNLLFFGALCLCFAITRVFSFNVQWAPWVIVAWLTFF